MNVSAWPYICTLYLVQQDTIRYHKKLIDWLIDYCFAPSELYFSCIQDDNTFNNILNYIEMRDGMGELGQLLMRATENNGELDRDEKNCLLQRLQSTYSFLNLQKRSLAWRERGLLQTRYPPWSTVSGFPYYNLTTSPIERALHIHYPGTHWLAVLWLWALGIFTSTHLM